MNQFKRPQYLNFDAPVDAKIIHNQSWHPEVDFLIFDELHKMKSWKHFLKGVFDTKLATQAILVTGSARLDTFHQAGESLAGRYFHYALCPLSVAELKHSKKTTDPLLDQLNLLGGFPEPFLSHSEQEAARWRNQYYTDLVREDILEFSRIQEIRSIRLLLELLRERVGSPLSYTNLANDLQLAPNTIRKYLDILSSLYIIFLVRPFHRNIARAILKEPKVYFYDSGFVKGDEGIRLENTCAVSLLKHVHYLQDAKGMNVELHYVRTKEGREIDFALSQDDQLMDLIEVKLSDDSPSSHLIYFSKQFKQVKSRQIVRYLKQEQQIENILIERASVFLSNLSA